MLHLAVKAFAPGPGAVPGDARRHRPQLRRGDRRSATARSSARRPAGRRPACRTTSTPAASSRTPARAPAATGCRPSRCCAASRSTASTPCSAAPAATRRRPAPRSGCSASATSSASGTRRTSGPSCGASTTAATARASTSGCSRCRTGPSSTSGSTSPTRSIELPVDLLRPPAPGVPPRRHAGWPTRRSSRWPTARRSCEAHRALPHRRRRHLHRRGRVAPPTPSTTVIAEVAATRLTERGATRADDRITEAGMEDRKREGYF